MLFTFSRKFHIQNASAAALCILFCAISSISGTPADSQSLKAEGGNFTLQSGKGPVSLADFRGKVVVIYFGYVSCGSICPISVSKIGNALRKLSADERKYTAGIFITVDPERDTPEIASSYASQFDPLITGLSGNLNEITKVANQYGVFFRKREIKSSMQYSCDHSSYTYIVNPSGKLVKTLPHGVSTAAILDEIRNNIGI